MYKIFCEYDFGQDDYVFASKSDAVDFLKAAFEANDMSYLDAKDDNLFSFVEVDIWNGS